MTREQATNLIPVMEAWMNGKKCEWRGREDGQWYPCHSENESFSHVTPTYEYRIKPEPKLRPWDVGTAKVGALLKNTDWNGLEAGIFLITGANADGVCWQVPCLSHSTKSGFQGYSELTDSRWVHSIDGGISWHLCGTIES